jgi:hypothetical protein
MSTSQLPDAHLTHARHARNLIPESQFGSLEVALEFA